MSIYAQFAVVSAKLHVALGHAQLFNQWEAPLPCSPHAPTVICSKCNYNSSLLNISSCLQCDTSRCDTYNNNNNNSNNNNNNGFSISLCVIGSKLDCILTKVSVHIKRDVIFYRSSLLCIGNVMRLLLYTPPPV